MKLLAIIGDAGERFVHASARGAATDAAEHRIFLVSRCALSLSALALAPLCLVTGARPAFWEAAALLWLSLFFVAALVVSRAGDLTRGACISLMAWIGLGVTVTWGTGSGYGLVLLLMVPIEAATTPSLSSRLSAGSIGLAMAMAVASSLQSNVSGRGLALSPLAVAALSGVLAYGGGLAVASAWLSRRRREEDHRGRERYEALARSLDDLVLRFDRSGGAVHVGCAATRLFSLAPHDLAGRGFFERLHVADRPLFLKLLAEVADDRRPGIVTMRLRTGRKVRSQQGDFDEPVFAAVDLSLRPPSPGDAEASDPRPVAAAGLLRDVSARVEQDRRAAAARASIDRDHAGRDIFLANVSHELRTPLNAIIGFAEMLSNEALSPADPAKRREYAGIIHQSGLHLLAVVNGILDASKLESGSFDIVPAPFALEELVSLCCDMVGLKAEQTGVTLARTVAPGAAEIVADRRACKQIILNLLSNALKFTPAGGRVGIAVRPDGNSVLITVSDTGVGVSARDLPRLGDPFFQARASYDRATDGTGLGLSVVRGLVGLHGGSIFIESAPGQGTRVTVRLPMDCRRAGATLATMTKIETIPRYSPDIRHDGVRSVGRIHSIA